MKLPLPLTTLLLSASAALASSVVGSFIGDIRSRHSFDLIHEIY